MKNKLNIEFNTGVKYNGQYFLAAYHMNALFSYDALMNKLTFLTSLSADNHTNFLYVKSFLHNHEAWFIPAKATHIAIVNLETFTVEHLSLEYRYEYHDATIRYLNYIRISENLICLLPRDVDAAMIINLDTREKRAYYHISNGERYYHCAVFENEKLFLFPWTAEKILVLDPKTEERSYLQWDYKAEAFGEAVYESGTKELIFSPALEKDIMVLNYKDGFGNAEMFAGSSNENDMTYFATDYKDDIFFWGFKSDIVIKMNKKSKSVKKYYFQEDLLQEVFFPICSNESLAGNRIIQYDDANDCFTEKNLQIDRETFFQEVLDAQCNISNVIGKISRIFAESEGVPLDFFTDYLLYKEVFPYSEKQEIGADIYWRLQDEIR